MLIRPPVCEKLCHLGEVVLRSENCAHKNCRRRIVAKNNHAVWCRIARLESIIYYVVIRKHTAAHLRNAEPPKEASAAVIVAIFRRKRPVSVFKKLIPRMLPGDGFVQNNRTPSGFQPTPAPNIYQSPLGTLVIEPWNMRVVCEYRRLHRPILHSSGLFSTDSNNAARNLCGSSSEERNRTRNLSISSELTYSLVSLNSRFPGIS